MYEFVNPENEEEYRAFIEEHGDGSFTQVLEWPGVKAGWHSEAIISRGEQGEVRGSCLVLIKKVPLSALIYTPRGPLCDYLDKDALRDLTDGIDRIAKKYHAFTCICDPPVADDGDKCLKVNDLFKQAGFSLVDGPEEKLVQCRFNYVLNFNGRTQDEIWRSFLSSYRNQILKANKLGVTCEALEGEDAIKAVDDFYPMMEMTGSRDGFPIRPKEYFVRFLRAMDKYAKLYMCCVDIDGVKTPLSGAITVNFGGRFSHVYGASSNENRKYCPNHKMQWTMMCDALSSGCRVYDFGGIPYYFDKERPEYGMYHFKKGFNGEVVTFTGQYVKVYRKLLNRLITMFSKFRG